MEGLALKIASETSVEFQKLSPASEEVTVILDCILPPIAVFSDNVLEWCCLLIRTNQLSCVPKAYRCRISAWLTLDADKPLKHKYFN
jgi:hypothetical protein